VFITLHSHRFRPDAALDFAYMGFSEQKHTEARLTYTATYGKGQFSGE
jgi:hypothetical protein